MASKRFHGGGGDGGGGDGGGGGDNGGGGDRAGGGNGGGDGDGSAGDGGGGGAFGEQSCVTSLQATGHDQTSNAMASGVLTPSAPLRQA